MTAFDPIYSLSREQIRERSDPDLQSVYRSIGRVPIYPGAFTKIPITCAHCANARSLFFSPTSKTIRRVTSLGNCPRLPFGDGKFEVTLISYLRFAYQDRFDYGFHRDSIREVMRVTQGEAPIYPTVTFEAQPSEYLPRLQCDPELQAFEFTEIEPDFESVVNSNSYLKVTRV